MKERFTYEMPSHPTATAVVGLSHRGSRVGFQAAAAMRQPYGVFAVVEKRNGTERVHYVLKDHLGSWTTITNANGAVEREQSFDAWGNLRNPDTWTNYTAPELAEGPMFDRGFTGHEHLYNFGLINMNGRMYDPVMSSFLSVDNYVQAPDFSQSFNRYAYCLNNPLKYTDPSGEIAVVDDILIAAAIGAAISMASNALNNVRMGEAWYTSMGQAAVLGAFTGIVGAGVGSAVASSISFGGFAGGFISGTAGGFAGGFFNGLYNPGSYGADFGESCLNALISGGIGALSGGIMGGLSRGIADYRNGYGFWDGKTSDNVIYEYLAGGKGTRIETDYNESMAARFNDEWLQERTFDRMKVREGDIGVKTITTTLNSDNPNVSQYGFATTGQYNNKNGYLVNGFRCPCPSGGSELHVSPGVLFASDIVFDATVGHELIHAYHHFALNSVSVLYTERIAHEYSYNVYASSGYYKTAQAQLINSIKLGFGPGPYPSQYIIPSKYPFSINYVP